MKFNLPSTLTSQKMSALFLLTALNVSQVKGGKNFRNCLQKTTQPYNDIDLYESIIKTSSLSTDTNSSKN